MLCRNGSTKKTEAPPYFDVRTGAICVLLGLPDSPLCQLLDTVPAIIGKPWKAILKETAKNLGKIIINTENNLIDTAAFCELEPPPMPDEINYAEVAGWIASYVPIVGLLPIDEPLIKKITAIYLHNTWLQYCKCKDKKNPPPKPNPLTNDPPPSVPPPPPNIHIDPPRNHRNWCYWDQWNQTKNDLEASYNNTLNVFNLLQTYPNYYYASVLITPSDPEWNPDGGDTQTKLEERHWYLISENFIYYPDQQPIAYNQKYVQWGLGQPETDVINQNGVFIRRTCYPFMGALNDIQNSASPFWNVRSYFFQPFYSGSIRTLIERVAGQYTIELIQYNPFPSPICFGQIIGYDGDLPPCPPPPDGQGGDNGEPPPPPDADDDCKEKSYQVDAWDGENCSTTNRILLDGKTCKLTKIVVLQPPDCMPSVRILRSKYPAPTPPPCDHGSEKKPTAPPTFNIETGAICFLLGLPDSPVCQLLDQIPNIIGKPWKSILKETAKKSWLVILDAATGAIDTADFCSTAPPPQPKEITYLEVAGWITSYLPAIGLLPIDDPLIQKITAIYLRRKWAEYCQCQVITPPPPPRNDYPISITIYFAVGNDGINPTIEDRNQDNWAITDNGDGTRTIQYLLQITVQLVADAQFQGYFEVLLNDGTVISGNYDGAIGEYFVGEFFSISYPSVTT